MSKQMKEIHDLHIEGLSVAQQSAIDSNERDSGVFNMEKKPTTAVEGDVWFDSSTGHSYVRFSSEWIQVGGSAK